MSTEDFKNIKSLKIYKGKQFVGTLHRTLQGCELVFADTFLNEPTGIQFSYRIKKKYGNYVFKGYNLPPFFAGLLPEGLRYRAVLSKLKTSEDDLFSIFAATGRACIGDVYAVAGEERLNFTEEAVGKLSQINFYELFQNIVDSEDLTLDASFAGVQNKMSDSMISFPVNRVEQGSSYILKLNPRVKSVDLVRNEHQCLNFAKKCGLATTNAKIMEDKDGNSGLLIERFDRVFESKTGEVLMLHQEDACQFLDRYSGDKYLLSLKEVCEGIRDLTTAPKVELLKTLRLYAFSYLVGNGDLHAKNLSLQTLPSSQIVLSPAYDLLCTYIYKDHKMALKLNGRDDNITRKDFIQFAGGFDIPEKAVVNMLEGLINRFSKYSSAFSTFMNEKQKSQYVRMSKKRLADLAEALN